MKKKKRTLITCTAVLLTALFVSKNICQITLIQGASMNPAYKNMQFALIDKRAKNFQCGDVIAFYCPALDSILVKRIIAVSGETVQISDGNVLVNGVKSPYVSGTVAFSGTASKELILSEGQFFVMGDNHAQSKDSRYKEIGCISHEQILGRLIPNHCVTP